MIGKWNVSLYFARSFVEKKFLLIDMTSLVVIDVN